MNDDESVRRKRDSAFSMKIGDFDNDGGIVELVPLHDGVYVVSQRAIHRIETANTIDSELSHPNTPHVNQRIANSGTESPIVCRTFLQAHCLFIEPRFSSEQTRQAKSIVLSGMKELLGAEEIFTELRAKLWVAEKDLQTTHQGTLALPSAQGVEVMAKAFVQRAEHTLQSIFQLTKIFIDENRKPGFFDGFAARVREKFSHNSDYVAFAEKMAQLSRVIRGIRHSIEHPKPEQRIEFLDYHFSGGQLHRPTVHVTHPDVPFDRMPLDDFMNVIIANLVEALEMMIVHLVANNMQPMKGMKIAIGGNPKSFNGLYTIRYGYLIQIGEPPEWRPLG